MQKAGAKTRKLRLLGRSVVLYRTQCECGQQTTGGGMRGRRKQAAAGDDDYERGLKTDIVILSERT